MASTNTSAISARDAATAIFLVYCSCPGASAIIKRRSSRSDIERYATSIVIPCSRSASSPSVNKLKSISPAGIIEPARRTVRAEEIVSCGTESVSTNNLPISVLFPSSTLPHVRSRIIGRAVIRNSPPFSSSPWNLLYLHQSIVWHVRLTSQPSLLPQLPLTSPRLIRRQR